MTKIIYKPFFLLIATLASLACQPVDEEPTDTDTTPECGEGETAVVTWCEFASAAQTAIWCDQCEDTYSCEHPLDYPMFVCDILESNYGSLRNCVSKDNAAHCLSEIATDPCNDYRWWNNCNGFSAAH